MSPVSSASLPHITILGIDPGSQFTGFGVVRVVGPDSRIDVISHGVIALPNSLAFNERIGILSEELEALLARMQPNHTVIERVFLGKNADSAFKLGHARGVAVAMAARAESEIVEYAAREVKKGVTGSGAASKDQVQAVLMAVLGLKDRMQVDASDALALAYHHARRLEVGTNLRNQVSRSGASKKSGLEA